MDTGKPAPSTYPILWLFLVISVSVVLMSIAGMRQSFWEDEAFSANAAEHGFAALPDIIASDVHPPLYLTLLTGWGQVFGSSEIGLRSLSILLAALAVWITYQIGRRLAGPGSGLLAAALLALSPVWVMFAWQSRYYALAAALATLLGLLCVMAQNRTTALLYVGYAACAVALAYSHYVAWAAIAGCALWWAVQLQRRRAISGAWIAWGVVHLVVGVASLPVMVGVLGLAQHYSQPAAFGNPIFELVKRLGYLSYVFSVGETISPLNPLAWLGLALVVSLSFLGVWHTHRQPITWLALIVLVSSVVISLIASLNPGLSITWQSIPTRTMFAFPFLMLLLAQGCLALAPRWRWITLGALAVVFAAGSFNFFTGRQYLRPVFAVPWREIFSGIRQEAAADAQVWCAGGEDYACGFYARRFGFVNATGDAALHSQVWWIEVNLGRDSSHDNDVQRANWEKNYRLVKSTPYARQDPDIRWLKQRFVGGEDYEYRVWVYRYELP